MCHVERGNKSACNPRPHTITQRVLAQQKKSFSNCGMDCSWNFRNTIQSINLTFVSNCYQSTDYVEAYGNRPVWANYRRNFKGQVPRLVRKHILIDFHPMNFSLNLTLFLLSPLSRQIGAEQINGSPGFRSADLSHTKHMTRAVMPSQPVSLPGQQIGANLYLRFMMT